MVELKIGLENVAIAETSISYVNGKDGQLIYRGHSIEEIVTKCCFEEVVYLLWYGDFPNDSQLKTFKESFAKQRDLPEYIVNLIITLSDKLDSMSIIRTAVSALELKGEDYPPTIEQSIAIAAKIPTIIAYYYRTKTKQELIKPNPKLSHVENYMYMLNGKVPSEVHLKALEAYLMISADHDMNASTFTARVVTSTNSDIISAVVAAIGSLKGPLHGGAPSEVDDMLEQIKTEDNIEPWLRSQLEAGKRIMGFGHRVYKTYDPRAAALKSIVRGFAKNSRRFKLSLHIEEKAIELLKEYKPGRNLYPNLEFWASGVLREIELPAILYTPTFCVSRVNGWCAQIIEQSEHNRIIRPSSIYIGKKPK